MLIIVILGATRYWKMCSERCDMYKEQKMKYDIADRRKETLKIVKDFTSDFGKGTFKT